MAQYYTVTATDSTGQQASVTISLAFSPLTLDLIIPVVSLVENTAISVPLIPTKISGGKSPYVFSISPELPGGLVFSKTRGEITGTPATKFDETPYTITVTDSNGETASQNLTIKTVSGIAINKLEPTAGTDLGGTTVTITGVKFTGATAVTFGTVPATSFTVIDDTVITAVSPEQSSGSVFVTVTTPDGTTAETDSSKFTYTLAPPRIDSISPNVGSELGGTTITISGRKLSGTNRVLIGGTSVNFTIVNDNTVTFVTPQRAVGSVDVAVTTTAGSDTKTNAFTYQVAPPVVTSVNPSAGVDTGDLLVTITGSRFAGATAVLFGTTPSTNFTVNSSTSITARTPARAVGPVTVNVTTPAGTSSSETVFTYIASTPTYSLASNPVSGSFNEGESITWTITTTNVANGTVLYWQAVGSVSATDFTQATTSGQFTVNNNTGSVTLTAVNDLTTEGNETFTFQVRTGSSSGPIVAGLNATIVDTSLTPPPTISGVSPSSGTKEGGTLVTITGSRFTGATTVLVGGASRPFTVVNDSTITFTTSAAAAGPVDISVTTPYGTDTQADAFTYTYRVDGIPNFVQSGVANTFRLTFFDGPPNSNVVFEDLTTSATFTAALDSNGNGQGDVWLDPPLGDHSIKITWSNGISQNYTINVI